MNECECGTQTLDHEFDCPAYIPYVIDERLAKRLEQERYAASLNVTAEKLRARALAEVATTNGHGGRSSVKH